MSGERPTCRTCGEVTVAVYQVDRNPLTPNDSPDELRCILCGVVVPDVDGYSTAG